jgi:hypothetical protein
VKKKSKRIWWFLPNRVQLSMIEQGSCQPSLKGTQWGLVVKTNSISPIITANRTRRLPHQTRMSFHSWVNWALFPQTVAKRMRRRNKLFQSKL